MSYLGTWLSIQLIFFSAFLALLWILSILWGYFDLPLFGEKNARLVIPLYLLFGAWANLVARIIHADALRFVEGNRRAYAHICALLPHLPMIGEFFDGLSFVPKFWRR